VTVTSPPQKQEIFSFPARSELFGSKRALTA
jgi:hypothetical protein